MNVEEIILANLILDKVKQEPKLDEHLKVVMAATNPDEINLAELFFHLDMYYTRSTMIKSAVNFLQEDVGIDKTHCVVLLCIADDTKYRRVVGWVSDETDRLLIARARTTDEAWSLLNYFMLENLICGLITDEIVDGRPCDLLLRKMYPFPCYVPWGGSHSQYGITHFIKKLVLKNGR